MSAATPATNSDSSNNSGAGEGRLSRYESQKRRDWNTFGQYLRNHRPPLALSRCSGADVLEFLRSLDRFGKTKVHTATCTFFGHPCPPYACPCPLRQAWGSLDALVGRLRAAFEENGGHSEANPFGDRAVRLYLREVRDSQAKARGITYEKRRRKRPPQVVAMTASTANTMMHPHLNLNLMNLGSVDCPIYQYGHVAVHGGQPSNDVAMVVVDSCNAAVVPLSVFD